jgi:hypothetical protein
LQVAVFGFVVFLAFVGLRTAELEHRVNDAGEFGTRGFAALGRAEFTLRVAQTLNQINDLARLRTAA